MINESADSEIEVDLEFEKIVTVQSRNERKKELCQLIHEELKQFSWVVFGPVVIEFVWYLHAIQRQETDKVGDLDNITKPILDSLAGKNSLLIDDSQIGSIHTFWISRNEQRKDNILKITLKFSNDQCASKKNLIFVQYSGATCLLLNVDFANPQEILAGIVMIKLRRDSRKTAKTIKRLGDNVDQMLVLSSWDIHRTRLNGFDDSSIYTLKQFKQRCFEQDFTWKIMFRLAKSLRKRS